MNTRTVLLVCALLSFIASVAACAPAQSRDPATVVQTAYDRLNKGDAEGYTAFYSKDAVLTDPHGRYAGTDAIRKYADELVSQKFRFEFSDISVDGNVVTCITKVYLPIFGDKPADTVKSITVVMDGLIVFDGTAALYKYECSKDPSQVFCTTK